MNILYISGYKKRFEKVVRVIEEYHPKSILELCFGDIFIAEYCKFNEIKWSGFDLNENVVNHAKQRFDNMCTDLLSIDRLFKRRYA